VSENPTRRPEKTGRQLIDGVDYYYEVHGRGEPLLLLHGGLGSIEMFGPNLDLLAAEREVIAFDLQGHGRTPLGKRPFSLLSMGDDAAELVHRLGHPKVDVLGYSLGGGVALRMALQQPDSVRRAVVASAGFSDEGFYPDLRAQQAQVGAAALPFMLETPMYKTYATLAPDIAEFPRLLDALGAYMREHYDWSAEIPGIEPTVMLAFGDSDMFRPEHVIQFFQLLGGGLRDAGWAREAKSRHQLAILPDVTHYEMFASPRLARTALPFLDARAEDARWR
jgi:pimeloyl-ACP methyl ester carboxylesterase